jgi:hypothetical protein
MRRDRATNSLGCESMPLRLGYMLARADVRLPWLAGHLYRGIDRLPFVPDPLTNTADPVTSVWNQYLDAWEAAQLARDLTIARRTARRLKDVGASVEVLFAEVAILPSDATRPASGPIDAQRQRSVDWLKARCAGIPVPDPDFSMIGLDVSSPIPDFHSAIFQPGIMRQDSLAASLNEAGLVGDIDVAAQVMGEANASGYGLGLFAVIGVWADRLVGFSEY